MPTYSNSTPAQLRKRLQELNEQLEKREPALVAEIRLVETNLKASLVQPNTKYADSRTPWAAIERCLDLNGDFKLTKRDIIARITEGGYMAIKPKAANGLINDSLNYHLEKGNLLERAEKIGRPKVSTKK